MLIVIIIINILLVQLCLGFSFLFTVCLLSVGYKIRVDQTTKKIVEDEITRKQNEYERSEKVMMINKLYEMKKVLNLVLLCLLSCDFVHSCVALARY